MYEVSKVKGLVLMNKHQAIQVIAMVGMIIILAIVIFVYAN